MKVKLKAKRKGARMGRPVENVGCKVEGCDGAHRARGYCARHYFTERARAIRRGTWR
jgi:hypothetical protein